MKNLYEYLTEREKTLYGSINWLHLFSSNGWKWIMDKEYDELYNYQMTLLSDRYDCTITAFVSKDFDGMYVSGDIGISWLECSYEYGRERYSIGDLEDMIQGIRLAEKNLVKLGIPFEKNYCFHQLTQQENYNLKRANLKNRKKLKCDEIASLRDIAIERGEKNE